jgi:asparagine synthase (glutamine-hydrolysing)
MLYTTPESLHETQPLVYRGGQLVLTADARIDNRDELLRTLRSSTSESRLVTDADLILAAYRRWGAECPKHLLGAFAFAIWDAEARRLFCARDHLGIKQLYYSQTGRSAFIFGSEIKAVLAHPDVHESLNEGVIGEHLAGEVHPEETIFQGIRRLQPAHSMCIGEKGTSNRPYWSVQDAGTVRAGTDEEYAERFHALFSEAVRCRLRSAYPVGAELSGGLDSSYVACVARDIVKDRGNIPLHTFSTVYERFPEVDERPFVHEVLDTGGFQPHWCVADQQDLRRLLDEIFSYLDDGRVGGNHHLNWLTARLACDSGVRVLLTGQDGDSTVYHGWQRFARWAAQGEWDAFAREADSVLERLADDRTNQARQETWMSPRDVLGAYGSPALIQAANAKDLVYLGTALYKIKRHFDVSPWSILNNLRRPLLIPQWVRDWRNGAKPHRASPDFIDPGFADRINLSDRLTHRKRKKTPGRPLRAIHKDQFELPFLFSSFEKIAHYAAAFGIEARHPFMDKRLVEFCVGLPPDQSLSNGWSRYILRRAMEGVVPQRIQWRSWKTSMAGPTEYLLTQPLSDKSLMAKVTEPLEGIVRPAYLEALREGRDDSLDLTTTSRIFSLGLWMHQNEYS